MVQEFNEETYALSL